MGEHTWIVDETTGQLYVEGIGEGAASILLGDLLPEPVTMGCAKPLALLPPVTAVEYGDVLVRISGYYHNSLVEGPGRRSVVRFQGCPIHCPGCWVPETWDAKGGEAVGVASLARLLLDPEVERDGVTILGGEPFAQLGALWSLIVDLRNLGCRDICVYTGYTLEHLIRRGNFFVDQVLAHVSILVDGPYVERLAPGGPWTGSTNQRVIDVRATHHNGTVTLYEEPVGRVTNPDGSAIDWAHFADGFEEAT